MKSWLLPLALVLVAIGLTFLAYRYGYDAGSKAVKLEWEKSQIENLKAREELLTQIAKREEAYQIEQKRIVDELARARQEHAKAISNQRIDYEQRLLQSTRRADMYRDQAEADAVARRNLAEHTARLDRALEEGRELVGELATALRFREHQLKMLGEQLMANRQLLGETNDR